MIHCVLVYRHKQTAKLVVTQVLACCRFKASFSSSSVYQLRLVPVPSEHTLQRYSF